jgi:hypothetical protein
MSIGHPEAFTSPARRHSPIHHETGRHCSVAAELFENSGTNKYTMRSAKQQALQAEAEDWIRETVNPNVFIVATLKQAIGKYSRGFKSWAPGSENWYTEDYRRFVRRLSYRLYGKKYCRRFKRKLLNAAALEGGKNGVRYHLNIMVHRPDWISFEDFEAMFREEWLRSDWAMPDLYIQERTGDCISYSLKEGLDSLIS